MQQERGVSTTRELQVLPGGGHQAGGVAQGVRGVPGAGGRHAEARLQQGGERDVLLS